MNLKLKAKEQKFCYFQVLLQVFFQPRIWMKMKLKDSTKNGTWIPCQEVNNGKKSL